MLAHLMGYTCLHKRLAVPASCQVKGKEISSYEDQSGLEYQTGGIERYPLPLQMTPSQGKPRGDERCSAFLGEQERRTRSRKEREVFLRHTCLPRERLKVPPYHIRFVEASIFGQLPELIIPIEAQP